MFNLVAIMGRLTADPELKKTSNGNSVLSFNVACERNIADKNGQRETDFFKVTAWRNTAEFISRYFSKGQMIAIEGTLQNRSYEDREGNRRTITEIIANRVHFTGSKQDNPTRQTDEPDFEEIDDSEDLPF